MTYTYKEPLYDELTTKNLVFFLKNNVEDGELIQTDVKVRKKFFWISPLIRSIAKKNIYFDISFPFYEGAFIEWSERKKNIESIKDNFSNEKYKTGICKLKKINIDYYVSSAENNYAEFNNYIVYKNRDYLVLKINNIDNNICSN